jgi:hypothetical protein
MGGSGVRPQVAVSGERKSWTIGKGAASGTVVLRFIGRTPTEEIPAFLRALTQLMPSRDAHLVFDLRALEGHNLDTRVPIQAWLLQHKSRIADVTVLVKKAARIIKMATAVVGLAAGIAIKLRDDVQGEGPL